MKKFSIEVKISLKAGILDPQGQAIENTLSRQFPHVLCQGVRQGKIISFIITAESQAEAQDQAKVLTDKILINPVMEKAEIALVEIATE
jgi:phosphoribosylformylglycinamidine synthase